MDTHLIQTNLSCSAEIFMGPSWEPDSRKALLQLLIERTSNSLEHKSNIYFKNTHSICDYLPDIALQIILHWLREEKLLVAGKSGVRMCRSYTSLVQKV